ncbi:pre-mRNA-splicing regulator female-lethal(2)D-like isoform X3 [Hetaerina americana]|uniref:pre-mRNA-splicing regulator female-lethal(2)D-like isoform X3 n=1 Tax=Hetaerina americana TaxID=62018 RepID=UPI003A7F508C
MSEESLVSTPMICSNGHQRRVKLTDQQFEKMTREEVRNNWHEQDLYIDILESQIASQEGEIASLRESEERMRQQHLESTHREKVLVRRLATKEQEMQEYASQIAEFKAGQTAGSSALRSALLDPAVNLLMQSLRNELVATKTRLEETQNELSAWKFTPDSNTGKRLMAKCRLLYQENEELGRMISSGRLAKLEGELALQKRFSDEVKKSQSELDEFLQELDEDVDGMQSTIYYLQQELKKSKEAYMNLQKQINSQVTEAPAGSVDTNKSVNIKGYLKNGLQRSCQSHGWEKQILRVKAVFMPNSLMNFCKI